jgi:RHS repeat-associated protein
MGREADSASGLRYYRARYYDERSGRFISEDPIKFAGSRNFYEAFKNDPVRYVDPTGFFAQITDCDDSIADKIRQAGDKARDAAQKCLGCEKSELDEFEKQLMNARVQCRVSNFSSRGVQVCGMAWSSGLVAITPAGFNQDLGCNCLEGTIFHEILHLLASPWRYDDDGGDTDAERRTRQCLACASTYVPKAR